MATKKNLKDLVERSMKAPRDNFGGWTPDDGAKFSFRVVNVTTKEVAKNGYPSWNLTLEVLKGEDKGKKARAYMGFHEEHDFINQRLADNFEALGIRSNQLYGTDPKVIGEMVKGKTGVTSVEHRESDNPNRPFVNYTFDASRAPAPGKKPKKSATKANADTEDGTDEEETPKRTRKAAAKKATKRRKAKPEPEPEPEDELEDEELEDDFDDDDVFDDEAEDEDEDEDTEVDEEDDDWEDDDWDEDEEEDDD